MTLQDSVVGYWNRLLKRLIFVENNRLVTSFDSFPVGGTVCLVSSGKCDDIHAPTLDILNPRQPVSTLSGTTVASVLALCHLKLPWSMHSLININC